MRAAPSFLSSQRGVVRVTVRAHPPLRKRHFMGITVAIMAQGTMGAGVGKRLDERGAEVRTLLAGRSEASAGRARAAGVTPAADERALLAGAGYFLSILPPDQAEGLAARLAPALQSLPVKP